MQKACRERLKKLFQKVLKNPLTNGNESDIIVKLSARRRWRKRERKPDGSLTIEQQEIEVQAKERVRNLGNPLKRCPVRTGHILKAK